MFDVDLIPAAVRMTIAMSVHTMLIRIASGIAHAAVRLVTAAV